MVPRYVRCVCRTGGNGGGGGKNLHNFRANGVMMIIDDNVGAFCPRRRPCREDNASRGLLRRSWTAARARLACSGHRPGHLHRPVPVAKRGGSNRGRGVPQRQWRPLPISLSPLARRACCHIPSLASCSGDLLPLRVLALCSCRQASRPMFIAGGTRSLLLPVLTMPSMCSPSAHSRAPIS